MRNKINKWRILYQSVLCLLVFFPAWFIFDYVMMAIYSFLHSGAIDLGNIASKRAVLAVTKQAGLKASIVAILYIIFKGSEVRFL